MNLLATMINAPAPVVAPPKAQMPVQFKFVDPVGPRIAPAIGVPVKTKKDVTLEIVSRKNTFVFNSCWRDGKTRTT